MVPLTIRDIGGCTCPMPHRQDADGNWNWDIDPACRYHAGAAEQPWNHRIPWNCPTYWDGCNCEGGPYLSPRGRSFA